MNSLLTISTLLLAIAVLTITLQKTPKTPKPKIVSCSFTKQIFINSDNGHAWPVNSISGCRCLLEYEGRTYIDYTNRHPSFCATEE